MAKELRTGQYLILDNKNNPHFFNALDDKDALRTLSETWGRYVVSVLSTNSITLVRPNGYILAYIDTCTGEQNVKLMSDWIK